MWEFCCGAAGGLVGGAILLWLGVAGGVRQLNRAVRELALDLENLEQRFTRKQNSEKGVASARSRQENVDEALRIAAQPAQSQQPQLPGRAFRK